MFNLSFSLSGYRSSLLAEGFGKTITSAIGIMQGCSLRSFPFFGEIQPLDRGITNLVSRMANAWLAVDANIMCQPNKFSELFKFVKTEGPKTGPRQENPVAGQHRE